MMKNYKYKLSKEALKKINPYNYQHHGVSFSDWLKQVFVIEKDNNGMPLYRTIKEKTEQGFQEVKIYKIKRKVELWMICLTLLIDMEFSFNKKNHKKDDHKPFVFYGRYSTMKNVILNHVPGELRYQLSKSISLQTISTAMKRIEASGFITIEYDRGIKYLEREEDKYFRSIKINHAKLVELSDFNVSKERSNTWKNYHRCSREHRWMRKRIISSLNPLINDLANKKKKEEYRKKLASLKLKLKGEYDVFQAFIIYKQSKLYRSNQLTKLTTIKSVTEECDELLASMYINSFGIPPSEYEQAYGVPGFVYSQAQEQAIQDFYARIK